jgi:hypothetical protein
MVLILKENLRISNQFLLFANPFAAATEMPGVCPRIRICRVPSAAWADARQRDASNPGTLSRSAKKQMHTRRPQKPGQRTAGWIMSDIGAIAILAIYRINHDSWNADPAFAEVKR